MTNNEAIEIITHVDKHIRSCDEYGFLIDSDLMEAHSMAVKALRNAWIPVTERLPEYDGTYLAFTTSGTVTTARWYAEHDMRNYRGDFIRHMEGRFHRNVTHWMPLPEPPKEDA